MTWIREGWSLVPTPKSKTNYCSDEDMNKLTPIKDGSTMQNDPKTVRQDGDGDDD